MKHKFYSEAAYFLGEACIAVGTAFMVKANFGLSMVTASPYLVSLKLSQISNFFTFGRTVYITEALLLGVMIMVLRKFKITYLFSFITAFLFGCMLDFISPFVSGLPGSIFALRIVYYLIGILLCAAGISFVFHTYLTPEVFELFVKEVSSKFNININHFKIGFDCISCLIAIILSFSFFGFMHFEGVKLGTIICALINGILIGKFSYFFEKHLDFTDALPFRRFFTIAGK